MRRKIITKRVTIAAPSLVVAAPPTPVFAPKPVPASSLYISPYTPVFEQGTYKFVNSDKTGRYEYDVSRHLLAYENTLTKRYLLPGTLPQNYQSLIVLSKKSSIPIEVVNSNVSVEIASPANAEALFVIPSQFNGVEYPNPNTVIRQFQDYVNDPTGGPAAQLAIHPAVGQFLLDTAFQTNTLGALLRQLPKMRMINGYLKVPQGQVAAADVLSNLDKVGVLLMENALVKDGTHSVNMIYASGVPINAYTNLYSDDNLRLIAYYIMVAQYYAALEISTHGRSRKVFLMLLGAGVFNNRVCEDTIAAIKTALYLFEQKYGTGMGIQVKILTYKGNPAEYQAVKECLAK